MTFEFDIDNDMDFEWPLGLNEWLTIENMQKMLEDKMNNLNILCNRSCGKIFLGSVLRRPRFIFHIPVSYFC